MSLAAGAALRSGCLSRRVGASILSKQGEVLATGRNDVPMVGGGLYSANSKSDGRCWAKSARCYNDMHKQELVKELVTSIREILTVSEVQADELHARLAKSRIRTLIEFSRAVHAEMDAIVSVARDGRRGLVDSTLL